MDRGTLLLVALAALAVAGVVIGVVGILLFRRDKPGATAQADSTSEGVGSAEPSEEGPTEEQP